MLDIVVQREGSVVQTSYGFVTITGSCIFVDFQINKVYCTYDGYGALRKRAQELEYKDFIQWY